MMVMMMVLVGFSIVLFLEFLLSGLFCKVSRDMLLLDSCLIRISLGASSVLIEAWQKSKDGLESMHSQEA